MSTAAERIECPPAMPTRTIWISYDLGVQGDYEGLYGWLDTHKARE